MTAYLSTSRLLDLSALEVHKLYKLRVDVFVAEQNTPYAEIDHTDAEQSTWHILAWNDGELVGTARIFPSAGHSVLGRLAVTPSHRGSGVSDTIIEEALRVAAERWPEQDVILDSQVPLVDFYGKYDFVAEGEPFDDTGVPHQRMRRAASNNQA